MLGKKVKFLLYGRNQEGIITVYDELNNYMEINNGIEDYRLDIDYFNTIQQKL